MSMRLNVSGVLFIYLISTSYVHHLLSSIWYIYKLSYNFVLIKVTFNKLNKSLSYQINGVPKKILDKIDVAIRAEL